MKALNLPLHVSASLMRSRISFHSTFSMSEYTINLTRLLVHEDIENVQGKGMRDAEHLCHKERHPAIIFACPVLDAGQHVRADDELALEVHNIDSRTTPAHVDILKEWATTDPFFTWRATLQKA
jgi:hypothetical protein